MIKGQIKPALSPPGVPTLPHRRRFHALSQREVERERDRENSFFLSLFFILFACIFVWSALCVIWTGNSLQVMVFELCIWPVPVSWFLSIKECVSLYESLMFRFQYKSNVCLCSVLELQIALTHCWLGARNSQFRIYNLHFKNHLRILFSIHHSLFYARFIPPIYLSWFLFFLFHSQQLNYNNSPPSVVSNWDMTHIPFK